MLKGWRAEAGRQAGWCSLAWPVYRSLLGTVLLFGRTGRCLPWALGALLWLTGAVASAATVEIIPLEPRAVEPSPSPSSSGSGEPLPQETGGGSPGLPARWFSPEQPFVALLPMSGDDAPAGRELAKALKNVAGERLLAIIDTTLFDDDELAQMAALYAPSWVFGPLRRARAEAFAARRPDLPMLRPAVRCPPQARHCLALLPSSERVFLHHFWPEKESRALYVIDAAFWRRLPPSIRKILPRLTAVAIIDGMDEHALGHLTGRQASQRRISWLRATLRHPVTASPRTRQDVERVVLALPLDSAYRVRTLLDFWQLPAAEFDWLPTRPVMPTKLWHGGRLWPPTRAFLPPLFVQKNADDEKVGIFRALAQTVATILRTRFAPDVVTPLGITVEDRFGWRLDLRPLRLQGASLSGNEQ